MWLSCYLAHPLSYCSILFQNPVTFIQIVCGNRAEKINWWKCSVIVPTAITVPKLAVVASAAQYAHTWSLHFHASPSLYVPFGSVMRVPSCVMNPSLPLCPSQALFLTAFLQKRTTKKSSQPHGEGLISVPLPWSDYMPLPSNNPPKCRIGFKLCTEECVQTCCH